MNPEKFADLQDKIQILFDINERNITSKAMQLMNACPVIYSKYVKEYQALKNLMTEKDKMYGNLWNKHKKEHDEILKTKPEIEAYIHCDDDYYKLCLAIHDQDMVVKYLEGVIDSLKKTIYGIQNVVELKKMGM